MVFDLSVPFQVESNDDIEFLGNITKTLNAYLRKDGFVVCLGDINVGQKVFIVPRLCGGKGGFGSMLRALGAQIEKTTNREACRDLSGRRLRDINEEKRLKNWIDKQGEREREALEKKRAKKEKLEKILEDPKHHFEDGYYLEQKEKQAENVHDAIAASTSVTESTSEKTKNKLKRTSEDDAKTSVKRKKMLWLGPDMSDCSDLSDSEEEANTKRT